MILELKFEDYNWCSGCGEGCYAPNLHGYPLMCHECEKPILLLVIPDWAEELYEIYKK